MITTLDREIRETICRVAMQAVGDERQGKGAYYSGIYTSEYLAVRALLRELLNKRGVTP